MEIGLMVASVALVLVAILAARQVYNRNLKLATTLQEKLSGVHKVLLNKYYVDELYGAVIVRPVIYFSLFLWKIFDVLIIDGLINGLAKVYSDISQTMRHMQTGRLRNYALLFLAGVVIVVVSFITK